MHAECASEHDVHGVDDDYRWTGDDDEEEDEEGVGTKKMKGREKTLE